MGTGGLRRAAALAVMALGLAAAGPMVAPSAAGGAAPRAPWCRNADLRVGYHLLGAAAGSAYGRIRIVNVSGHTCRIGGYGGVSYVGHGDGTQIGAAADREPGRVRVFALAPGQRLVSRVREVNAGNFSAKRCQPRHVDGFRVYVPDARKSQFVAHPTTGCKNAKVHLLSHRPYRRP